MGRHVGGGQGMNPTDPAGAPLDGNNLIDTLGSVVATGRAALLVVVPGKDETVRVNGAAWLTTDDGDRRACRRGVHARREGVSSRQGLGSAQLGRTGGSPDGADAPEA